MRNARFDVELTREMREIFFDILFESEESPFTGLIDADCPRALGQIKKPRVGNVDAH